MLVECDFFTVERTGNVLFQYVMLGKAQRPIAKPPTKEEKERLSRERERRSSLLILDLKTDKLYDSEKEDESKTFYVLQVLGMKEDL